MRKIVLTFGLIAGAMLSAMMIVTLPFEHQIGYDNALVVGYTTMVLAFLMIFFGVRSYRENVGGGTVGFGRALAVGTLIAVIASACYVATWEVIYFKFEPDFLRKLQAHQLEQAREKGASEAAIAKQKAEGDKLAVMYDNPLYNSAMTFLEPLPVGIVIALVTAGLLSRKKKGPLRENGAVRGARAST